MGQTDTRARTELGDHGIPAENMDCSCEDSERICHRINSNGKNKSKPDRI